MKNILIVSYAIALIICCNTALFSQSRIEPSELQSLFGKPVGGMDDLFSFNEDYAIQLKFDNSNNRLIVVSVAPKFFFASTNPRWSDEQRFDVALTASDYQKIIHGIQKLEGLGEKRATSAVNVVTNLKSRVLEVYENGVIEQSKRDSTKQELYSFKVWYMRRVSGRIEEEVKIAFRPNISMRRVKINGCWYYASDSSPVEATKVAGPLDGCDESLVPRPDSSDLRRYGP